MQNEPIPTGCHDADSAAHLLGMEKNALLKKMREWGWLTTSKDKFKNNLPYAEYIRRGWLTTHNRCFPLKGRKEIIKQYCVMLLTQQGFNALKSKLQNTKGEAAKEAVSEPTKAAPSASQRAPDARALPVVTFNRYAIEHEHQKFLDRMAELNLPIAAGRNK